LVAKYGALGSVVARATAELSITLILLVAAFRITLTRSPSSVDTLDIVTRPRPE